MKSNPVLPGGPSVNKPTWPNTFAGVRPRRLFSFIPTGSKLKPCVVHVPAHPVIEICVHAKVSIWTWRFSVRKAHRKGISLDQNRNKTEGVFSEFTKVCDWHSGAGTRSRAAACHKAGPTLVCGGGTVAARRSCRDRVPRPRMPRCTTTAGRLPCLRGNRRRTGRRTSISLRLLRPR